MTLFSRLAPVQIGVAEPSHQPRVHDARGSGEPERAHVVIVGSGPAGLTAAIYAAGPTCSRRPRRI